MGSVEPIPGEPAAVVEVGGGGAAPSTVDDDGSAQTAQAADRLLVIADYHAGFEAALRAEGVELRDRGEERRSRVLGLIDRTAPDHLVFLGDLAHWIGRPDWGERDELLALLEAVTDRVPATLVKGNHDGELEAVIPIPVSDARGVRIGDVGFAHGHTWPAADVLAADVVCVGHEHPTVRLEDAVGGRRVERVWLRGPLAPTGFADRLPDPADLEAIDGELVVFPAFNELVGGTWINVAGQEFLAPFLPAGLADGEAYLLDGTRLGPYRSI